MKVVTHTLLIEMLVMATAGISSAAKLRFIQLLVPNSRLS